MGVSLDEVRRVTVDADCLYAENEVEACLDRMADDINARLGDEELLALCTMNGAVVMAGKLLPRLKMPLVLDYIHATRYQNEVQGGEITWLREPDETLVNRNVLVLEDIFDQGITLAAILEYCHTAGARKVFSAALIEKRNASRVDIKPDFAGLVVPDRYVFGYGMDYKGYLRNAAGIYAVKGM
jgi:hypoxanthine phosphoribosyltransferase